jgi:hypothetical protein
MNGCSEIVGKQELLVIQHPVVQNWQAIFPEFLCSPTGLKTAKTAMKSRFRFYRTLLAKVLSRLLRRFLRLLRVFSFAGREVVASCVLAVTALAFVFLLFFFKKTTTNRKFEFGRSRACAHARALLLFFF